MEKDNCKLCWKTIEKRTVFKNKYMTLRNDLALRPDGQTTEYIVVENRDYSAVVCISKDKKIPMVRQFRYPWMKLSWEIPAGLLECDESSDSAAKREVEEETACIVDKLEHLVSYYPLGSGCGMCHLYFAEVENTGKQKLDDGEFLYCEFFTIDEVKAMMKNGEIIHSATLMGINWAINAALI